jgi:hypothetical protein
VGSGAVIYILSYIKINSGAEKLIGRYIDTHGHQRDLISLLYFFRNKDSRIKSYVRVNESSEIMKYRVTIATDCRRLTRCMNISYVVSHEQARRFCLVYCVYSVIIDNFHVDM